jgi:hypothetical protein
MTATLAAAATESWEVANQQHLTESLRRVRALLEQRQDGGLERPGSRPTLASGPAGAPVVRDGRPMALDQLCGLFRLSPFERDVLLLCAGVELDASFATLVASVQGDPQRSRPTFSLALTLSPDAHWSALSPASALRRWRLIELTPGVGLTASPLRIDERVLHHLTGVAATDERLAGVVHPVRPGGELAQSHRAFADLIASVWSAPAGTATAPVIQICGDAGLETYAIAAAGCRALGLGLAAMMADAMPQAPGECETLARVWEREAALSRSVLLVDCGELDAADAHRSAALTRFLEHTRGPILLATRDRRRLPHRQLVTLEVGRITAEEQRAAWHQGLGESAARLDGQLDQLASQFSLGGAAISAAITEARGRLGSTGNDLGDALWAACRSQARPKLDDLAQRIDVVARWDDLILPDAQRQILRDVTGQVRRRRIVYERWGFGRQGARGLGISALFAGTSGTGKTMAAEVLANELRLDLYRIDLSSVVSKYIGETEKNLRRVFDAAEEGGAILLFDEADALFGKRSEVRDSHDRYANIEVSYLLQRMECYCGLAILTTNMKSALDDAFLRRIRFIVQFPFPDTSQRAAIWRRIFPAETPTDGLAAERLAQLEVAGGNIRSIALNAAFLAADADEPVRMGHLLHAARTEYAKLEKALTEAEVAGWD